MKHVVRELGERAPVEFLVEGLDFGVLVASAQRHRRVALVEALDARFARGLRGGVAQVLRLAAPADAPARAGHHFDEVVVGFALLDAFDQLPGRGGAVADRHLDFGPLDVERGLLHVADLFGQPAHGLEVVERGGRLFAGDVEVRGAKRRFHHAPGVPEDHTRAGSLTHEGVVLPVGERPEVDPFGLRPFGEFGRRDHVVRVAHAGFVQVLAGRAHFFAADFGLLRRAGRHRHVHDGLRVQPHLLREIGLHRRALHADRALRGRDVGEHLRMVELAPAHPGGAAARELRERPRALRQAFDEFRRFLDDREVGGEVRVEHVVGAELPQERNHPPLDERTLRLAHRFADPDADGGRRRKDDDLPFRGDFTRDGLPFVLGDEAADGADLDALPAVRADAAPARLFEVVRAEHAHVLLAGLRAERALDAEVLDALDGGVVRIDRDTDRRVEGLGHGVSQYGESEPGGLGESLSGQLFHYGRTKPQRPILFSRDRPFM